MPNQFARQDPNHIDPTYYLSLNEAEKELAVRRGKIFAIKGYRARTYHSLQVAKAVVEYYLAYPDPPTLNNLIDSLQGEVHCKLIAVLRNMDQEIQELRAEIARCSPPAMAT